jgi:hypothetical protein
MRASGVGITAAQRPTGPAVTSRPSDIANIRRSKHLTDLGCSAATTVSNHEKLAGGAAAAVPEGASRFHGGAGASEPSDDELNALAARASTPADHHALEEYFQGAAKRYREAVNEHTAMAHAYRGTRIAQAAVHCDRLVTLSRDAAKEAAAAADMHKQLATVIDKKR